MSEDSLMQNLNVDQIMLVVDLRGTVGLFFSCFYMHIERHRDKNRANNAATS